MKNIFNRIILSNLHEEWWRIILYCFFAFIAVFIVVFPLNNENILIILSNNKEFKITPLPESISSIRLESEIYDYISSFGEKKMQNTCYLKIENVNSIKEIEAKLNGRYNKYSVEKFNGELYFKIDMIPVSEAKNICDFAISNEACTYFCK